MKATYKIIIDMETLAPATVWHSYFGPVDWMKASDAETNLSNQQAEFYKTLSSAYNQQFSKQGAILQSLTDAFKPLLDISSRIANTFSPILAAGPGQKGFTPEEESAIRTSATDTNAQQFTNAKIAVQNANQSGGNELLPSGAQAQLEADVNTKAAVQEAQTQNQITQQNYNLGRQNFLTAAQILGGVSSQATNALLSTSGQINPLGYASGVDSSGQDAFGSASAINQENNAWKGVVGGILGGAVEGFAGGFGTGAGKKLFGL
ncbi:MAG: hypothetical protein JWQ87_2019 [Candidatus Sulfotelmatobacter sp.]|nr:hypothetical protein [Candidatus Sulfotelmatobacter sp.]